MEIDSDKDVVFFVKKILGCLGDRPTSHVELSIYSESDEEHLLFAGRFSYFNLDDMVSKLFEFSLSRKITSITSHVEEGAVKILCIDIIVEPSKDETTNITPRLIEFFNVLLAPVGLERLRESLKTATWKPCCFKDGQPIIMFMEEHNEWDYWLERDDS